MVPTQWLYLNPCRTLATTTRFGGRILSRSLLAFSRQASPALLSPTDIHSVHPAAVAAAWRPVVPGPSHVATSKRKPILMLVGIRLFPGANFATSAWMGRHNGQTLLRFHLSPDFVMTWTLTAYARILYSMPVGQASAR